MIHRAWQWLQGESGTEAFKAALCLLLAVAVVVSRILRSRQPRTAGVFGIVLLAVTAALACGAYVRFGKIPWAEGYNSHEVFHYYLGSKYHREVGYSNLYRCVMVADLESDQRFRQPKMPSIRDADTLQHVPRESALADAAELLRPFSPERWREFKDDVAHIAAQNRHPYKLITDLGYVATPFWTVCASWLTNRVPADTSSALAALCAVDYLLVLAMTAIIGVTCGWVPALVCLAFFGLNISLHSWTIKGSVLRFDWLVALVTSVCLLRAGWYKTAGVCGAFSVMVRVFPILFLFGLGIKALMGWIQERRLPLQYRRFFGAFTLSVLLFALFPVANTGGFDLWRNYLDKMDLHSQIVRVKRMGFAAALTYRGEDSKADYRTDEGDVGREEWSWAKGEDLAAYRPWLKTAFVVVLLAVAMLSYKLEDDQTTALGVLLLYFAVDVSWYYYSILVIPCVVFSARIKQWQGIAGIALLCGFMVAAYWIESKYAFPLKKYALLSWLLMAYLAISTICLALSRRRVKEDNMAARRALNPQGGGPG